MDAFQVPVSALITICVGLTVLAVAVSDSELWRGGMDHKGASEQIYTTESERLVSRYIQEKEVSYDMLVDEIESYFGDSASESLLKTVDRAIEMAPPPKLARLYNLRGLILRDIGLEDEAVDSFRKSLMINPDNMEARMGLVIHYMKTNMFGLARSEIGKAINSGGQIDLMPHSTKGL
ncbi:hypothetical protein MNBD_NITROSPINAE02-1534 [hydrothermal vent metagenome]|uniref:Uncharacterized protein n=1 Tax=hydrothermal vent metagenome TaxID=652676 RepID=A0A3B1CD75_9ZZZZ